MLASPMAAKAQEDEGPSFEEMAIMAGGQADALAVACGATDEAGAAEHRGKLQASFAEKNVSAETFAKIYDPAYARFTAQAKANPEAVKQACAQLKAMGTGTP